MPQNPSQLCRECKGHGSAGLSASRKGFWLVACPICGGHGRVTIAEAKRRDWRPIRHTPKLPAGSQNGGQRKLPFQGRPVFAVPSLFVAPTMSATRRKPPVSVAGVCNTLQQHSNLNAPPKTSS